MINGLWRKTPDIPSLRVGEVDITSSTCITALGVHKDNMLIIKKKTD